MIKFLQKPLFYCFIVSFMFAFACKSKVVSKKKENDVTMIKEKLITQKTYNEDSTYLLIANYYQNIEVIKNFKFKVMESSSKKIIFEGEFNGTKLEWHSKTELKGHLYEGMVKEDDASVLEGYTKNNEDKNSYKIIKIKN